MLLTALVAATIASAFALVAGFIMGLLAAGHHLNKEVLAAKQPA